MRDMCRLMVAYNDRYAAMSRRMRAYLIATILFASLAAFFALLAALVLGRMLWLL